MKKLILVLILFLSLNASAFDIKNQQVTMIIPAAPGGTYDLSARHLQKYANDRGINIVVIFKSGADGLIGTSELSKMPRDGLYISLSAVGIVANHQIRKPEEEITVITQLRGNIFAFVSNPTSSIKTFNDLEQSLKNGSDTRIGYGTPGQLIGWNEYFELVKSQKDPLLVPYKGTGPVINDLLGGHIDVSLVPFAAVKQYLSTGKLRLLAVTTARPSGYSEVTLVEQKFPSWRDYGAQVIAVPKGTDPNAIKFWSTFLEDYLKNKQVQNDFIEDGSFIPIFGPQSAYYSIQEAKKRILKIEK